MYIYCEKCGTKTATEEIRSLRIPILNTKFYCCIWCISEHCKTTTETIQEKTVSFFTMLSNKQNVPFEKTTPFELEELKKAFI